MKTPYFSVVIPTKGRSFLMAGAIESVLRQTFSDLELIVCDNDDGEATHEVVARFNDPRLRYHRTGNLSMPDNWDNGFAQARGEYLLILEDKQAFKLRSLERIHRATEKERPECLRWLVDWLDDTGTMTFVDRPKTTGAVRLMRPNEILEQIAHHDLDAVSRYLPIGHFSGFHRSLCDKIRNGAMHRLCPPVSPDYTLGYQAVAYAESVLFFDEALVASSRVNSNGRSFVLKKGDLRHRFVKELGGSEDIFFDCSPVKAITIPGSIYNDYLRVRQAVGGRLLQYPINWPNYFAEIHRFIVGCQENGVNMDSELKAWEKGLQSQTADIQARVAEALCAKGPIWKDKLHSFTKGIRRKTGLLGLEHAFKARLNLIFKRKLAGRFTSLFQYIEWEDAQANGLSREK